MGEHDFSVRYLAATHALHIYPYQARMKLGQRELVLRPGDLTLTPAGVPSRYLLHAPNYHWCVHFQVVKKHKDEVCLPLHLSLGPQRDYAVQRLMQVARLQAQGQARGSEGDLARAAAAASFQELLLWVAMLAHNGAPSSRATRCAEALDRLVGMIDLRFAETLSVPQLAEQVEVTHNYLARRFRQRFGMTIPRYLLNRRIEHARYLLANTDMPIGRIASRVGMPDPQHFNKQFRRLSGMSPSQFRDQAQ